MAAVTSVYSVGRWADQWNQIGAQHSSDLLSDASSSMEEPTRFTEASSRTSTKDSQSDVEDNFFAEDAEEDDEDSSGPKEISKSMKRRQRRQRQRLAIRASAAEPVQNFPSAMVGSPARRNVTLQDLGFDLGCSGKPAVHTVLCPAQPTGAFCNHEAISCNRVLDAVRPPPLDAQQACWPPASPTVTNMAGALGLMGTSPVGNGPCEASARVPPCRVRMGASSELLATPPQQRTSVPPSMASPQNAACATEVAFQYGLKSTPPHVAVPMLPAFSPQGTVQAMLASPADISTTHVGILSPCSSAPSPSSIAQQPGVAVLTSPSSLPQPDSTFPHGFLSSIVRQDDCALRSWLGAGGLPCSPCSESAAQQLRAAVPEIYED